jgi:hypothetical protein
MLSAETVPGIGLNLRIVVEFELTLHGRENRHLKLTIAEPHNHNYQADVSY